MLIKALNYILKQEKNDDFFSSKNCQLIFLQASQWAEVQSDLLLSLVK